MEFMLWKLLGLAVIEFLYHFWMRLTGRQVGGQPDTKDQD